MAKDKKDIKRFHLGAESEQAQFNLAFFNAIKSEEGIRVCDIGLKADLPEDIVSGYINACVRAGLLSVSGTEKGGKVNFNTSHGKMLGVGFSADQCILTVVDLGGKLLVEEKIDIVSLDMFRGRNKEVNAILEKIGECADIPRSGIAAAGIALPSIMEEKNPKAAGILAEGIRRLFECEISAGDEVVPAGYGEKDALDVFEDRDILYMHSDVGAGAVFKEESIFRADRDAAAGTATYLRPWEQFSITSTAKTLVSNGVGTSIVNIVKGDVGNITLGTVFEAADAGDELAADLVRRAGLAMGVRVAYLMNMFNVCTVVLGGGIEHSKSGFADLIAESAGKFTAKDIKVHMEIIPGRRGSVASSIGAALLCRRATFMEV
jgi:predicted NBD/HSP70 family sugar kinase